MKMKTGFTIIETLIGISLLAMIVGGILGALIFMEQYIEDGIALAKSQGTARILIEKMLRPVRYGKSFVVSAGGDTLTVTNYDNTIDVFAFNSNDNTVSKNGDTIGSKVYKITDAEGQPVSVFQQMESNKLVKINFETKNTGIIKQNRAVHISTDVRLRNEASLSQ